MVECPAISSCSCTALLHLLHISPGPVNSVVKPKQPAKSTAYVLALEKRHSIRNFLPHTTQPSVYILWMRSEKEGKTLEETRKFELFDCPPPCPLAWQEARAEDEWC